jgi:hypothetical protein
MPYNIGRVSVTGDVYVSMNYTVYGMTNVVSTNVLTADMTAPSSNSFWWIGEPMEITEDLFASTNYPMNGGYQGPWWEYWWGYENSDDPGYVWSSAGWGVSWSKSISKYYMGKRVILKWSFSRCRPNP